MQKRIPVTLALAVAASLSTWFYTNRILRAQQIAYAAAHSQPRGNLSDLYPRWLGARELLKHGRNPYSAEITREIQQGYYGRQLDASRANEPGHDEPKDQQGFAYPAYVVFLLAPTVDLPFDKVQIGFRWLLIGLAVATVFLWLRVLRWKLSCWWITIFCVLLVGWLPMVQGIKLQQLSLLVAAMLAACAACLSAGWLFLAGGAAGTCHHQTATGVADGGCGCWFGRSATGVRGGAWCLDSRLVMLLLLGGAELVLPGWLRMFYAAIQQYHQYTQNQSVLVFLFGGIVGRIFEVLSVLICALCLWSIRREASTSAAFGQSIGLVLALTVAVVPMFAPYNQVLLVPAILALLRSQTSGQPVLPAIRMARTVGGVLLVWPWIATLALTAAYLWMTPELRQKVWFLPFYTNFLLPIFVFGLALLDTWMNSDPTMQRKSTQAA